MQQYNIIIFGSSHLAIRLQKHFLLKNKTVLHCSIDTLLAYSDTDSLVENLEKYMQSLDLSKTETIYILDEKDEINLQLIIALLSIEGKIAIVASIFNENLIPHLQQSNKNLKILNRAKIASPVFVDAVYKNLERKEIVVSKNLKTKIVEEKKDSLIKKLIIILVGIICSAIFYFHFVDNLKFIDAIYFVVTTATSTGYGDINLLNSSVFSKIVGILLMLSSTIFIWLIFSLTIDFYLKQQIQISLGRKKYQLKNHIVLCGLGKVGYFVVEALIAKQEKVIIVEIDEHSKHIDYFRSLGAEVYIGDARQFKVMKDVNVFEAKALISVIDNDAMNLEIGLNARSIQENLRLILRIFDDEMSIGIKKLLNIELTFSASTIALKQFIDSKDFFKTK